MAKKVVIIFCLIFIPVVAAAYYLYPRGATYTFYGTEIVTTTASSSRLGTILHQTAWESRCSMEI